MLNNFVGVFKQIFLLIILSFMKNCPSNYVVIHEGVTKFVSGIRSESSTKVFSMRSVSAAPLFVLLVTDFSPTLITKKFVLNF